MNVKVGSPSLLIQYCIAQGVSVMTVQASGARLLLRSDPDRAREAILAVEDAGREALTETRRLLGVLRRDSSEPQLVAAARRRRRCGRSSTVRTRAGCPTTLAVEGEPQTVPASVADDRLPRRRRGARVRARARRRHARRR